MSYKLTIQTIQRTVLAVLLFDIVWVLKYWMFMYWTIECTIQTCTCIHLHFTCIYTGQVFQIVLVSYYYKSLVCHQLSNCHPYDLYSTPLGSKLQWWHFYWQLYQRMEFNQTLSLYILSCHHVNCMNKINPDARDV